MTGARPKEGVAVESSLPSRRLLSSTDLGWRTIQACTYHDPGEAEQFVTSPSPDLLLVLVTTGRYRIESRHGSSWRRADYHPGSVGVTSPGNVGVLRWRGGIEQPMESLHLRLSADLLSGTLAAFGLPPRTVESFDTLSLEDRLVGAVAATVAGALADGAAALYADSLAQTLATHLVYRTVPGGHRAQPQAPERALDARSLRRVTEYMRAHLSEEVALDDLAGQANLSKFHFLRLFSRTTGLTPHRYLVRMRLQAASVLLRSTGQTVRQISMACGYRSAGQFSSAFRREYGTSPNTYRRESGR